MPQERNGILNELKNTTYDVIVIGGGITGAGIAHEAAVNGLSVLLLEKKDFSWGTSSRSSKLVHGGLRYLEQMYFHLVFEALSERTTLFDIAPVDPLPFLFPTYKKDRVPFWFLEMGMFLYDALALFRAPKLHRFRGKKGTLGVAPRINPNDLISSSEYFDGRTDDSRLVIEVIRAARRRGADTLNYAKVTGFGKSGDEIRSVQVKDTITGKEHEAHGRVIINAAGPWLEEVIRSFDKNHPRVIRASKGVHLFVPVKPGDSKDAVVISDSKTKRILFYVPWKPGVNLLGTTDTDYQGDYNNVYADSSDVDYILANYDHYFPGSLRKNEILSSNAGLRPLIFTEGKDERTTSREHRIIVHDPYNLVSIGGGKLTTYRVMAKQALDAALGLLKKRGMRPALMPGNRREKIVTREPLPSSLSIAKEAAAFIAGHAGYTDIALRVNEMAMRDSSLAKSVGSDARIPRGLIRYFIEEEQAMRLEDIMDRRLRLSLTEADGGMSIARPIAAEMAKVLGWNAARTAKEVKEYQTEVNKNRASFRKK